VSRLRGQALLVIGLPLLLMLLALLGVLQLQRATERDSNFTALTDARLYNAELLLLRLVDSETGVRGYAVTHNRRFLDPYNAAVVVIPKLIASLRVRSRNVEASIQAAAIARAAQSQMLLLGRIRSSIERGNSPFVPAALLRGKASMDAIRALVDRYESTERAINAARLARAAVEQKSLRYALAGILVLAIAGGLIAIFLFASRVVRRLASVIAKTEDVAADRALAAPLRGNDEIAAVDRAVHQMAAAIRVRGAALARYRLLADVTHDIILFIDRSALTIVEANAAAQAAYGYERSDLIGLPTAVLHALDDPIDAEIIALSDTAAGLSYEGMHRRSDGSVFPVEVHARTAEVDGRLTIIKTIRDISERRHAAEQISLGLQRYHMLADATSDIIVFIDRADLVVVDANAAALAAYGYERTDFIGLPIARLRPPDEPYSSERIALAETQAGFSGELLQLRSDGTTFPVEIHLGAADVEGRRMIIATLRDISERRRAAEQITLALDQAIEASRLKSEFVATMSHEIRTPMHGVIGMSELLLETQLMPQQREYALTVKESAQALLAIIDDILDFSKLEANKIELEAVAFDPLQLVASAVNLARGTARDKGLRLHSAASPHVPAALRGDPTRLRQVLINLIGNAVKFTAAGEVVVSIAVDRDEGRTIVLSFAVRDTGIGVSPEARDRLFEAFVQGDGSTTRRFGGTGLGLSISRRLVELMGGRIWLGEHEGPGATFCFTARFERTPEIVAPITIAAGNLRVLVVDDDATTRRILESHLTGWGMQNASCEDLDSARAQLRVAAHDGKPFDVVLIDYVLPRSDGLAFAAELGEHPEYGYPSRVLITAFDAEGRKQAALAAGCAAHLRKPIDPSELYNTLGEIERARRSRSTAAGNGTRSARILMAEDSALIRRVARFQLEELDYPVDIVENGQQAVAAVASGDYQLILMDMRMPEMDGLAATRAIREAERTSGRHIVVIALTANVLEVDREACIEAGMDDFLAKPLKLDALRAALERWLPEAL